MGRCGGVKYVNAQCRAGAKPLTLEQAGAGVTMNLGVADPAGRPAPGGRRRLVGLARRAHVTQPTMRGVGLVPDVDYASVPEFDSDGARFLFDLASAAGAERADRTVAAWGRSRPAPRPRDEAYQRGIPHHKAAQTDLSTR